MLFFLLLPTEQFNDRILQPELLDEEMMSLHEEVVKIYKTYCLHQSIDKIKFDPFIVEEIKSSKWSALERSTGDEEAKMKAAELIRKVVDLTV